MSKVPDRGQMLVITGLLLAVALLGLALVVNSAIYAENLGTRESSAEGTDVLIEQGTVDRDVLEALDRANTEAETADYDETWDRFESNLGSYAGSLRREGALEGHAVDVWTVDDTQGVRLRQTDESRNFTSATDARDWTLTEDVPEAGHFIVSFQTETLLDVDPVTTTVDLLAAEAFTIEFHLDGYTGAGDGVHRVYFFEGEATDRVYALHERPDQNFGALTLDPPTADTFLNQSCVAAGETVPVRFSQATFGGGDCDPLEFYAGIGTHDVRYENAVADGPLESESERAKGTYDIMLEDESASFNGAAFEAVGDGQPFYQTAVYAVWYSVEYSSADTTYTAEGRAVKPTATDAAGLLGHHPGVRWMEVRDVSATTPAVEVDWGVTDPDGRLERVELYMVDDDGNVVDGRTKSADGSRASGVDTLSDSTGTLGEEYDIRLVVISEDGRVNTETETMTVG